MKEPTRTQMPSVPQHQVPGAMVRVNLPLVDGDYTIDKRDFGVALTAAGKRATLPCYDPRQQSLTYIVKNLSTGNVQVYPGIGSDNVQESFHTSNGPSTCDILGPDQSRSYVRETTSNRWLII